MEARGKGGKFLGSFEFVINKKKANFHFPLYIFEAKVSNFSSTDVKILKHKSIKVLRELFRPVKKDYEILYQKFLSDVKTDTGFCYKYGMLLEEILDP